MDAKDLKHKSNALHWFLIFIDCLIISVAMVAWDKYVSRFSLGISIILITVGVIMIYGIGLLVAGIIKMKFYNRENIN